MKIKSLMNNPASDDYDVNMKNHIDGKEVKYGDVIEISKEFRSLPTFKSLINNGFIEEVKETKSEDKGKDKTK